MVMTTAIPDSTTICWVNGESATMPRVMAMISAERMKSVRTAPLILAFSNATRSTLASATASLSASCSASVSALLCRNLCASFSKPSKHR
ncbi:hypothetical protein D3C71_1752230 [compost metagenome]